MTAIYLGELCFPVPPETLTLSGQAGHQRVTLCDVGEITQLRSSRQLQITFSSFFPPAGSRMLEEGGVPAPSGAGLLREMLQDKKPRLFVAAGVASPLSMMVTVESLRLWETAGDCGTIYFELTLQEYRQAVVSLQPSGVGATSTQRESSREAVGRYTVVQGDTLWAIAKRFLGDGSRYKELAGLNGIQNPNLIYPGQVIRLS